MSITDVVAKRGITEVLHFTTNEGLVGIFQSGAILSRHRLPKEKFLEYIYKPNCKIRKDTAWLDYVNLSLTWINPELFRISSGHWHKERDIWWCVLVFDPQILEHKGVHFATTNNMYSGVKQAPGEQGLLALFAGEVIQYVDSRSGKRVPVKVASRPRRWPANLTTCAQAEVLYPEALSLSYLKGIYVASEDQKHRVHAAATVILGRELEVWVKPELFEGSAPETEP